MIISIAFLVHTASCQVITEVNIGEKSHVLFDRENTLKGKLNSSVLVEFSIQDDSLNTRYFIVSQMITSATVNTGQLRNGDGTYSIEVSQKESGTVIIKLLGKLTEPVSDVYLYEDNENGIVLLSHIIFISDDIYPSQFEDAENILQEAVSKGFPGELHRIMIENAKLEWHIGNKQSAIAIINDITSQVKNYLEEYYTLTDDISELWNNARSSGKTDEVSENLMAAEDFINMGEFKKAHLEITKAQKIIEPGPLGRLYNTIKGNAIYIFTGFIVLVAFYSARRNGKNQIRI
ncbi:MAG: hypothetical protein U9P81_08885 [Euryarchaeota archaeon]|nr:hypothetical protein [Euryarchaeota archaeon]